jgi:hypothetical protein
MKIDINSISKDDFVIREFEKFGEKFYLVFPQHMGCKWTQENAIFRSSIWNSNGELVSASFKKFTNWGEAPEVFPVPYEIKNCQIIEKLDGSTLIVSKYKGNFFFRTRGTYDASFLELNGDEIEIFKKTHSKLLNSDKEKTWDYSILFEWTSPKNKIILNYGDEPKFYLIGKVFHKDYSLESQANLDFIAELFDMPRPKVFKYDTVSEMMDDVHNWKGLEGCVIYSNHGQTLHKTKSTWYLTLHRLKSEIATVESLIKVWYRWNKPEFKEFYDMITDQFDYELAQQNLGNISRVCDVRKEVDKIIDHMVSFIKDMEGMSRKDQAIKILDSYGKTSRSGIVFHLLDGKQIEEDEYIKLMIQIMSK